MFTQVLMAEERGAIKKFLSKNGVKERRIRQIASRAGRFMPQIACLSQLVLSLVVWLPERDIPVWVEAS